MSGVELVLAFLAGVVMGVALDRFVLPANAPGSDELRARVEEVRRAGQEAGGIAAASTILAAQSGASAAVA